MAGRLTILWQEWCHECGNNRGYMVTGTVIVVIELEHLTTEVRRCRRILEVRGLCTLE